MKIIELSNTELKVLVDDEDFDRLSQYKWWGHNKTSKKEKERGIKDRIYAECKTKGKHYRMHRLILDCPKGLEIDHIDGNRLNNQKSNLRIVTHQQNLFNQRMTYKDKFKGISFHSRDKIYEARIRYNDHLYYLGRYTDPRAAALAYDFAAVYYFGEYACLNFKDGYIR